MFHGNVSADIANGLVALRKRIDAAKIPSSKLDETLNIATWNIREFGKKKRSQASIHYIAEILGQFDIIGIVELRDNLEDLGRVLQVLGPYWRVVYSDEIRDFGGNWERTAYVYDKRAVVFNGLAAEATGARTKKGAEYIPDFSFWRSPYIASFKAGNFDFVLLTVHIRWGDSEIERAHEIERLADWIEAKRKLPSAEDKDWIVMGDFNIPSRNHPAFKAVTKHGLRIPTPLLGINHGTNLAKDKYYDQILHYPAFEGKFTNAGGVVDFFVNDAAIKELYPAGMSRELFTYQMSDHLPLWLQINTDIDGQQLDQIIQAK